jgi:hypothetical protein
MIGGEWNYQLRTRTDAEFSDPTMEMFEPGVRAIVGRPGTWYATGYLGAGVLVPSEDPRFELGITIPSIISKGISRLNIPEGGFGLQVAYLLPAEHKRK